jgi:putative DNA primase/helicase
LNAEVNNAKRLPAQGSVLQKEYFSMLDNNITPNRDKSHEDEQTLTFELLPNFVYKSPNGHIPVSVVVIGDPSNTPIAITADTPLPTNTNVYFAPAMRKRPGNLKEDVDGTVSLWVDVDNHPDQPETVLPASLDVSSGGGWHLHYSTNELVQGVDEIERLNKILMASIVGADPACFNANRILRVPGSLNMKYTPPRVVRATCVRPVKYSIQDIERLDKLGETVKHLIQTGDMRGYHSRSERDWAVVMGLVEVGYSDDTIRTIFQYQPCGDKFREEGEHYLTHTLEQARVQNENPVPLLLPTLRHTANYFIYLHGDQVRYNHTNESWYIWDGKRWAKDEDRWIWRIFDDFIPGLYGVAAKIEDLDTRTNLIKWISSIDKKRENKNSVLKTISEYHPVACVMESFDCQPYLLNVLNGTIDLRNGNIKKPDPRDMITKLAPTKYVEGSRAQIWDDEIDVFAHPNPAYMKREMGSSIYPRPGKKPFYFVHGEKNSAKSTIFGAVGGALGNDYVSVMQATSFQKGTFTNPDGARDDLASLAGVRLVIVEETDDVAELDVTLLKRLTGGLTTKVRALRGHVFDLQPDFTLWFASNYLPHLKETDDAVWDRARLIDFIKQLKKDEIDKHFSEKLATPEVRSAILSWLVEGCVESQKTDSAEPESIRKSTENARYGTVDINAYVKLFTDKNPDGAISGPEFNKALNEWLKAKDKLELTPQSIKKVIGKIDGVTIKQNNHGVNVYHGLKWKVFDAPKKENDNGKRL